MVPQHLKSLDLELPIDALGDANCQVPSCTFSENVPRSKDSVYPIREKAYEYHQKKCF